MGGTPEERKAILDHTLQEYEAGGWRVETRSDFQATIGKGEELGRVTRLLVSFTTYGIWLLIILGLGPGLGTAESGDAMARAHDRAIRLVGGVKRRKITVDESGKLSEQKL